MAGIYIHIPFCVRKCLYCDFVSYPDPSGIGRYLPALKAEMRLYAGRGGLPDFDTVFFGGGTPSLLTGIQLQDLLSEIRRLFTVSPDAEITVECNPGTVREEDLERWSIAGVNRLSIGLQSSDDALLARIGRIHTLSDFTRTLDAARKAGFENINVDVMHGLPGQTAVQYLDTLKLLAGEGIPHISSYALILEENTPLHALVRSGRMLLPDDDAAADMEDAGIGFLRSSGYVRYEISNFCLPGHECRHNLHYWRNDLYLGLGAAAHGCLGSAGERTRYSNLPLPDRYEAEVLEGRLPVLESRTVPAEEQMFESIMLGLRTTDGVDLAAFRHRFGTDLSERYPVAVGRLRENGWIIESASHLRLNDRGLDMNNAAIRLFMEAQG